MDQKGQLNLVEINEVKEILGFVTDKDASYSRAEKERYGQEVNAVFHKLE